MKNITLLVLGLFFAFFSTAQVSKTVNVQEAGSLNRLLTWEENDLISNITITGNINTRDIVWLRNYMPKLSVIDLGGAYIQEFSSGGGIDRANEISNFSFMGDTLLRSIVLPNSVTYIGMMAFEGCVNLTSVTFGQSVLSIGNLAFNNCISLANIILPNSITSVGDYNFSNCKSLKSVILPNSVTSIGLGAFLGCTSLESVNINDGVISIGDYAFSQCIGLTTIILPSSLTSIGVQAFNVCGNLKSISIPSSVISIGSHAFGYCNSLKLMYVYAATPIVLSSIIFDTSNSIHRILYVPIGSKVAYQEAPIWKDWFYNINEMAPTGISEQSLNLINIYPNPATDGFQISELEGEYILTIVDLKGNIVLTKQAVDDSYVSISTLPKGMYILKIFTASGPIEKKIIKN